MVSLVLTVVDVEFYEVAVAAEVVGIEVAVGTELELELEVAVGAAGLEVAEVVWFESVMVEQAEAAAWAEVEAAAEVVGAGVERVKGGRQVVGRPDRMDAVVSSSPTWEALVRMDLPPGR